MWQLNVLHCCQLCIPLGLDWVCCSQDGGSGIQLANDTSLGYGQSLLLLKYNKVYRTSHFCSLFLFETKIQAECLDSLHNYSTLYGRHTITSWSIARVLSLILSNSSIQQMPLSLNTSAPLKVTRQFLLETLNLTTAK